MESVCVSRNCPISHISDRDRWRPLRDKTVNGARVDDPRENKLARDISYLSDV